MNGTDHIAKGRIWAEAPRAKRSISFWPGGPSRGRQGLSLGLAFAGSSSISVRLRSLFVVGLRLDPGDGILPCTTVTELIDLRDVERSPSVCRYLFGSGP